MTLEITSAIESLCHLFTSTFEKLLRRKC